MGLILAWESRRQADYGFVIPMALAAIVAMPLGIWLLLSVDSRSLTIGISIAILIFVGVLISGWRYHGPRPLPLTLGIGMASGAMMATSSIGGPAGAALHAGVGTAGGDHPRQRGGLFSC